MTLIVIRHANDEGHKPKHRHDQEITNSGRREARRKAVKLIEKYGNPDIIYCSPMIRTKQTLIEMLKYVKGTPQILVDNRLSRYFSSREQKDPSVFTVTSKGKIPIYESYDRFKDRCDSFLNSMRRRKYIRDKEHVVWVITHTLVIKRILRKRRMSHSSYMSFLQHYRLR